MMKYLKFITLSFFILWSSCLRADEGMWIPLLLDKYTIEDMQSKGFKLSAEDIYSINRSSMKDAIVRFGGGCTGELVSDKGLILTNYHCGYSAIQSHSSLRRDYLKEGFWAAKQSDELKNPGLTATFLIRMEDVTEKVLRYVGDDMTESDRMREIAKQVEKIERKITDSTHYNAKVKSFYYGNQFFLFVTETFHDVRLVGAPPSKIGKFGGDTDNWMWPRHTGDFCIFRIYANEDNKPTVYRKKNKPYQPKYYFPITTHGVGKNDFTMVYGFPGRTQQYLTSHVVRFIREQLNPAKIELRQARMDIMKAGMDTSRSFEIQYTAKYARMTNYWKNWQGVNRGLDKYGVLAKKEALEERFDRWAVADTPRVDRYGGLIGQFEQVYDHYLPYRFALEYLYESVYAVEMMDKCWDLYRLEQMANQTDIEPGARDLTLKQSARDLREALRAFFDSYSEATDKQIMAAMLKMYYESVDPTFHPPDVYQAIHRRHRGDYAAYVDKLFESSMITKEDEIREFLKDFSIPKIETLNQDPLYIMFKSFLRAQYTIGLTYYAEDTKLDSLYRIYVTGLREMQTDKRFYPDANSTLRVAYGKVEGYEPKDGITYEPFTTLEGIVQKWETGNEDYKLPKKLYELYQAKDYGRYGQDGQMPVCFLASNHTSGGNSGSPVLNGEGYLVGINFDRNWEGTMSDLMYDPNQCRNIVVDIRYVLFIIDKYAGAQRLIEEMVVIDHTKKKDNH